MSESVTSVDTAEGTREFTGGFAHRLYTGEFEFKFIPNRRRWYTISAVLLLISVVALLTRGLNLGIDFKGGSVFTAPVASVQSGTVSHFKQVVADAGVSNIEGFEVTTVGGTSVRIQTRSLDTSEVVTMRSALAKTTGTTPDKINYSLVGPSWGQQITDKAVQALIVFLVLVGLMIWVFFRQWRMAVSALVALAHDLLVTVGFYALIGFTVSPATLIGVLTILGYSLYDTVVVFDKVRENTRDIAKQDRTFSSAANVAVNQVLVRSINTTLIGILPVVALLIAGIGFLGGEGPLADLGLALFIGMVTGAYSSIFIATPLLAQLTEMDPQMKKHAATLARRRVRAAPKVTVTTTDVDSPAAGPAHLSEETVVPAEDAEAVLDEEEDHRSGKTSEAGRSQPVHKTRRQRKK